MIPHTLSVHNTSFQEKVHIIRVDNAIKNIYRAFAIPSKKFPVTTITIKKNIVAYLSEICLAKKAHNKSCNKILNCIAAIKQHQISCVSEPCLLDVTMQILEHQIWCDANILYNAEQNLNKIEHWFSIWHKNKKWDQAFFNMKDLVQDLESDMQKHFPDNNDLLSRIKRIRSMYEFDLF